MVTTQKYALNEAPQLLWVCTCVAEHSQVHSRIYAMAYVCVGVFPSVYNTQKQYLIRQWLVLLR